MCGFLVFLQTFAWAENFKVKVGDTPVVIKKITNKKGKNFVHLHQNEHTALKAAKVVVEKKGGSVLTLVHPGGRNIRFCLHHKRYEFDPNRIFTDVGIKKTLKENGQYSSKAHQEVKKLANEIKRLLPKGKVIAVHNNQHYSLKDYYPGHEQAENAKKLTVPDKSSIRNFFVVTKLQDFMRLKRLNLNGIWQKPNAKDDGSLSIYLAKKEYINIEAGYNQLAAQIKMLSKA